MLVISSFALILALTVPFVDAQKEGCERIYEVIKSYTENVVGKCTDITELKCSKDQFVEYCENPDTFMEDYYRMFGPALGELLMWCSIGLTSDLLDNLRPGKEVAEEKSHEVAEGKSQESAEVAVNECEEPMEAWLDEMIESVQNNSDQFKGCDEAVSNFFTGIFNSPQFEEFMIEYAPDDEERQENTARFFMKLTQVAYENVVAEMSDEQRENVQKRAQSAMEFIVKSYAKEIEEAVSKMTPEQWEELVQLAMDIMLEEDMSDLIKIVEGFGINNMEDFTKFLQSPSGGN